MSELSLHQEYDIDLVHGNDYLEDGNIDNRFTISNFC